MEASSIKLKTCSKCGVEKPSTSFHKRASGKFGVRADCKACMASRTSAYHKAHPEVNQKSAEKFAYKREARAKGYWAKCVYGVDRDAMLRAQDFKCLICGKVLLPNAPVGDLAKPHIDHCHESGVVRGILCPRCNIGLGYFQESAAYLRAAAEYVEQFEVFK